MASATPATGIPERIGRYRIVRPLSKGGMALVFEGRRESLAGVSPRVAIKVILPDYAASATFRDMFINEARLGAAMQHQNLVQIQDFDSDGERFFLVMEYVEGFTLSRSIGLAARHGVKVPLGVLCEVGRQVCDGLHYAHQAVDADRRPLNLVHRDIKPSNLIITPQGGLKILDFGISKGRLRAERSGSVKGTWGYMSPEQALGEKVGPTADIFCLGIVLYEMAARRSMFKGKSEEEIKRLLQAEHPRKMVSALDSSYAPIQGVLERALQRDRHRRYLTAADFGRALSELLPDPISARDQTVRFYQQVRELDAKERAKTPPRSVSTGSAAPASSSQPVVEGARALTRSTATRSTVSASPALVAFSVAAGALAVISAFVLAYTLLDAADFRRVAARVPSGDIATEATPERPLPVGSVGPTLVAPAEDPPARVVVRKPAPGADPAVPVAPTHATLVLGTVQDAEIYLDGKLLRPPYNRGFEVPPGRHHINFLAPDGRRYSQNVELEAGEEGTYVWDFDRWDYR